LYYLYSSITGKHFNFEWQSSIVYRVNHKNDCPYLCGQKVYIGFNDLETIRPDLAKEWHPTKNGNLQPSHVTLGSGKKVWWYLPYDDPETGKHFNFEWQAVINTRVKKNAGCPFLISKKTIKGINDLTTVLPEIIKEWHPTKNGNLKPENYSIGSHKIIWWYLSYDDPKTNKHFDFEWKESIHNRIRGGRILQCPYLAGKKIWSGYNDLASQMPEIAEEWHFAKNRKITPEQVAVYSDKKVWWKCNEGHEWRTSVHSRTFTGSGCPKCNQLRQ